MSAKDLEQVDAFEEEPGDDADELDEELDLEEAELHLDDTLADDVDLDEDDDEEDGPGMAHGARDEDDDEDDDEDEDDEDEGRASPDANGHSDPASLDELLDKKPGTRAVRENDDDADIMSLVSGHDDIVSETLPSRVAPVRAGDEFVCKSCFLVRSKTQLADGERQICRDCA